MDLDPQAFDDAIGELIAAHRRALAMLHRGEEPIGGSPLADSALLHPERHAALSESRDPVARAILPWFEVLLDERWAWEDERRLSRLRHSPHDTPHLDEPSSIATLVRGVLGARSRGERRDHGRALAELAGESSARAVEAIEARRERASHRRFGEVAELTDERTAMVAEAVLDRTEDVAAETMRVGWIEGIGAALGRDATEGWPARLTPRWLGMVFRGSGLSEGLRPDVGPLPVPRGATSFARALGQLGVAVLTAGRPRHLARALHLHPHGLRRHRRYGLFASVVLAPSFAQSVLGLGGPRAAHHARAMARATAASLRVEAMRLLVARSLADGRSAARERMTELSERLFDEAMPPTLLAVFPRLRPAQAAAFAGSVMAARDHQRLVESYDEDWFRNPRAVAALRDADQRPRHDEPIDEDALRATVETLGRALEAPF